MSCSCTPPCHAPVELSDHARRILIALAREELADLRAGTTSYGDVAEDSVVAAELAVAIAALREMSVPA